MRVATLRHDGGTAAVVVDDETVTPIAGVADVGELLGRADWRARAASPDGETMRRADIAPERWAPVVPHPGKVLCVGLNYRGHILEMGRELPEHPTLFAKFDTTLTGAHDEIVVPAEASAAVDWEAELAIVIGRDARNVDAGEAAQAIAGFTVLNDVSMRDWQNRTVEWLQGKNFARTTPIGPVMVTSDAFSVGARIRCEVGGEAVQDAETDDLVFPPAELVSYISRILPLAPGDVIATGTPAGVGHARTPARYLRDGDEMVTAIDGIGELRNRIRFEAP